MFGLDDSIAALGEGQAFLVIAGIAVLLGLRHATDPDHLTAVTTLVAGERQHGARRAGSLGLSWGLGHATTLILFGVPIVLFRDYLPERVQQAAEVAIGVMIMVLAVRLILRWRNAEVHSHTHSHAGEMHSHTHVHEHAHETHDHPPHEHPHAPRLGRGPLQAYSIGLVHGLGGSAGVGVLLLAAIPDHVAGLAALVILAIFTAASMAIASTAFGYALARGPVVRRLAAVAPGLGYVSLAFGAWYALGAMQAVPYYF
jgi:ABC-type nickel/cobalt efflux system permease component RcnA